MAGQRLHPRWQVAISVLLLVTVTLLAGALALQRNLHSDWTAVARHTLTPASVQIVNQLSQPLTATIFTRDKALARAVEERLGRYQQHSDRISFRHINPDRFPAEAAAAGVRQDGLLHLQSGERSEIIGQLDEQSVSNAILRLSRGTGMEIRFISGHGQPASDGQANHDFGSFSQALRNQGFSVIEAPISPGQPLPTAATLLVLTTPQTDLSSHEVAALLGYISEGGSLLWLGEPAAPGNTGKSLHGLTPLATELGIRFLPGTLVDPAGMELTGSGAFTLATRANYREHSILGRFELSTLFPLATGVSPTDQRWQSQPLIIAADQGWLEQGPLTADVSFDPQQDLRGPATIALAMERTARTASQEQTPARTVRAVVVGDGDFLSNAYLGNGGNLQLGINMINWLAGDERLINIPPVARTDLELDLSPTHALFIAGGFLFLLPLIYALIGARTWWRYR